MPIRLLPLAGVWVCVGLYFATGSHWTIAAEFFFFGVQIRDLLA